MARLLEAHWIWILLLGFVTVAAIQKMRADPAARSHNPALDAPSLDLSLEESGLANAIISQTQDHPEVYSYGRQLGYISYPHPLLPVFDQITSRPRAEFILEDVLRRGSPAAKLYALTLLKDVSGAKLSGWGEQLRSDHSSMLPNDGCTAQPATTVSKIADRIVNGPLSFAAPSTK